MIVITAHLFGSDSDSCPQLCWAQTEQPTGPPRLRTLDQTLLMQATGEEGQEVQTA